MVIDMAIWLSHKSPSHNHIGQLLYVRYQLLESIESHENNQTADMKFMKSVTFFPFFFLTAIVWSQFARTCMYVCMHVLLSMLYMHIRFVNSTCTCIHI